MTDYAMKLSKMVSEGDLSLSEVAHIAEISWGKAGKKQEVQCKSAGQIKWSTK
jgi:hypothetical protein